MQHQSVYKAFHPHPELISNAILGCRDAHPFFSDTLFPLLVRRAQAVIEPPGTTPLVAPRGKEHSILWATGACACACACAGMCEWGRAGQECAHVDRRERVIFAPEGPVSFAADSAKQDALNQASFRDAGRSL